MLRIKKLYFLLPLPIFFSLSKLTSAVFAFIPLIFDIFYSFNRKKLYINRSSCLIAAAGFLGHFSFHLYNYFHLDNFYLYSDAIAPWYNDWIQNSPYMKQSFFEGLKLNKGLSVNMNNIYEYFHWFGCILFIFLVSKKNNLKLVSIFLPAFILISLSLYYRTIMIVSTDFIRRSIPTYIILFITIVPLFSRTKYLKILMVLNIFIGFIFSYKGIVRVASGLFF